MKLLNHAAPRLEKAEALSLKVSEEHVEIC